MKVPLFSRAANRLSIVAFLLLATTLVAQQLQPARGSSDIARSVCSMIERDHITHHRIDDEISTRLTDKFLKEFDPQKLYFYQADIDEFQRYRTTLDDQLKTGNVDFAFHVFSLYLQRLDERVKVAQKLIDVQPDFTVNENMPLDGKDQPWAKSSAELDERWRKRIKYELLTLKLEREQAAERKKQQEAAGKKPVLDDAAKLRAAESAEDPQSRLHKRYRTIARNFHQMDNEDVLELYLTALANCFDPHSSYMGPQTLKDFQIQMQLHLEGIGAALKSDDGYTVVATIVPKGAAAEDGRLKVGDKIVGVGQETGEIVDVVEMRLRDVVSQIRGKRNTKVRLKVLTPGSSETKLIELTRRMIPLEDSSVKGEIIDVSKRLKGAQGRIGIINIPSFYRDFNGASAGENDFKSTARDVKAVLRDFHKQGGVNGIIIDLRTNGGGALSEAIDVSGLFISSGPVVQVKDSRQDPRALPDEDEEVEYTGPLVVLCNRLSASASEIFAGVIKDYKRGIIIGDMTTHGKGTVQNVNNVGRQMLQMFNRESDKGALKLTIQQFYRVNGDSTQNIGVPSDVVLPSLLDHMDLGESSLENAMAFDRVNPVPHEDMNMVTSEMVTLLKERSQTRINHNREFQDINRDIKKFQDRKQRKSISLNEVEMKKERLDEEARTKKRVEEAEEGTGNKEIFPNEYYNNEALAISLDYVAARLGTLTVQNKGN